MEAQSIDVKSHELKRDITGRNGFRCTSVTTPGMYVLRELSSFFGWENMGCFCYVPRSAKIGEEGERRCLGTELGCASLAHDQLHCRLSAAAIFAFPLLPRPSFSSSYFSWKMKEAE